MILTVFTITLRLESKTKIDPIGNRIIEIKKKNIVQLISIANKIISIPIKYFESIFII